MTLRFPNKAPSVYTRFVANTLQLSYKRIGRGGERKAIAYIAATLYGVECTKGIVANFLRWSDGKREREQKAEEKSRESRSACIDLSSSAPPRPFSNFRSAGILCKPTSILTAYLAWWKEGTEGDDDRGLRKTR